MVLLKNCYCIDLSVNSVVDTLKRLQIIFLWGFKLKNEFQLFLLWQLWVAGDSSVLLLLQRRCIAGCQLPSRNAAPLLHGSLGTNGATPWSTVSSSQWPPYQPCSWIKNEDYNHLGWVVLQPFDTSLLPVTSAVLSCLLAPSVLLLLTPCQQQAGMLSGCLQPSCLALPATQLLLQLPHRLLLLKRDLPYAGNPSIHWGPQYRAAKTWDTLNCEMFGLWEMWGWGLGFFYFQQDNEVNFRTLLTFTTVHLKNLQVPMKNYRWDVKKWCTQK